MNINWFVQGISMTGATQSVRRRDAAKLKYLTENFNTLQGLSSVAIGIGYAVFMMCNAYWGSGGYSIIGVLSYLGAYKVSETYIPRYYARRFGCVKPTAKRVRWSRRQIFLGFIRFATVLLVWILAEFFLPDSVPGSRFTNSMVLALGFFLLMGLSRRKGLGFVLGIAVAAFALAPIWYPLNESQLVAWKVINAGSLGLCSIAFGLWDHITLIYLFRNAATDDTDE